MNTQKSIQLCQHHKHKFPGNPYHAPYSYAYCSSSDLIKNHGDAHETVYWHFKGSKWPQSLHTLPIGSILSHFDHYNNKFLFTIITKNYITDHPSYYALSMALHNFKNLLWEYQILDIFIPKPESNEYELNPCCFTTNCKRFFGPTHKRIVRRQPLHVAQRLC